MAKKSSFRDLTPTRLRRYFEEGFKRKIVSQLESNQIRISQVCREYDVSSTAVYKWLNRYSKLRSKGLVQVVEPLSLSHKVEVYRKTIKDLEQVIGQKQMLIDFKDKLIELAEEHYKVDIKKKFGTKSSGGSGTTMKSIRIK